MELISNALSKLGFDWQIALANLVNFVIVYFLLKKVVFDKIHQAIKERQKKIAEGLSASDESEKLKQEAEEYKLQIQKEMLAYSSDMKNSVALEKEKMLVEAKKDIERIIEINRKDALGEKNRIIAEAKRDVAEIVVDACKKILDAYEIKTDKDQIKKLLS
jgi:F-type H+-transporting ATPase subunit b